MCIRDRNKDDQVIDNKVSDDNISDSYNNDMTMKGQQNVNLFSEIYRRFDGIDERLPSINSRLSAWEKQIQDNVNDIRKRKEERKREAEKLKENKESELNQVSDSVSGGNDDDNLTNNADSLSANEVIDDKVSGSKNNSDMTNSNGDIIKNVVSELSLIHI